MAKKTLISANCLKRMQLLNQLRDDLRDAITADFIGAYAPEHSEVYKELNRAIVEAIKVEAKFIAEWDDWPL